ncbi:MAG: hypothetical protein ACHQZS_09055 [Candidatus Binatales bacterium]
MADDFDDDLEDREPWLRNEASEDLYFQEELPVIEEFINSRPDRVYYERQLQVRYEDKYFHWVTTRVLNELVADRLIRSETLPMGASKVRFFFSNRLRYWRRQAKETLALIMRYSQADFIRALGHQAEMLFDAAMPREGFIPVAQNVREYGGRKWEESQENLDRIFVRDGIAYGAEIKNTLRYIDGAELASKLKMCQYLGPVLYLSRE